jgi:hypothetical protein
MIRHLVVKKEGISFCIGRLSFLTRMLGNLSLILMLLINFSSNDLKNSPYAIKTLGIIRIVFRYH